MPTFKKDFDRSQLWPRGPSFGSYKFANGYSFQRAMERWGPDEEDPTNQARKQAGQEPIIPLDSGALRVKDGKWEVFIGSGEKGQWDDFNPLLHMSMANLRNRYGLGGEAGGAHTGHGPTHIPVAFFSKFGRDPDPMEIEDYSHDPRLAALLFGGLVDQPTNPVPTPTPAPVTVPVDLPAKPVKPPAASPPASPVTDDTAVAQQSKQVQRLMNLIRPFVAELVRLNHEDQNRKG